MPYSKYHWQPPADRGAISYDPAKARQLLDAAGYKDVDGDGFRETKDGKKLSLRLYATSDSPENQTAAKLIVGWLKDVGVKLQLQVLDSGALIDAQYNYKGDAYAPDWDLFIWHWTQDVDPNFIVDIYTPQQIEGWNDCLWTDPEYTKLNTAAGDRRSTRPSASRSSTRCRRSSTKASAYAILTYPFQLEAYDSAGLDRLGARARRRVRGAAGRRALQLQQHRHVPVRRAEVAAATSSSSSNGGWIVGAGSSWP